MQIGAIRQIADAVAQKHQGAQPRIRQKRRERRFRHSRRHQKTGDRSFLKAAPIAAQKSALLAFLKQRGGQRRHLTIKHPQPVGVRAVKSGKRLRVQLAHRIAAQQAVIKKHRRLLHRIHRRKCERAAHIAQRVTLRLTERNLRTGEHHRPPQPAQHLAQSGGAIGERIGTVQNHKPAVILAPRCDRIGKALPGGGGGGRAVNRRLAGEHRKRHIRQRRLQTRDELRIRHQPGRARLHADGAARINHQYPAHKRLPARHSTNQAMTSRPTPTQIPTSATLNVGQ